MPIFRPLKTHFIDKVVGRLDGIGRHCCVLWTVVHSPYAHYGDAVAAQIERRENDRPAKEIRWGLVGGCLLGLFG